MSPSIFQESRLAANTHAPLMMAASSLAQQVQHALLGPLDPDSLSTAVAPVAAVASSYGYSTALAHKAKFCYSPEGWGPASPVRDLDFTPCFQDVSLWIAPVILMAIAGE